MCASMCTGLCDLEAAVVKWKKFIHDYRAKKNCLQTKFKVTSTELKLKIQIEKTFDRKYLIKHTQKFLRPFGGNAFNEYCRR